MKVNWTLWTPLQYKNQGTPHRNYSVTNISSINMYAKIIVTLCALGLARGSGLYDAPLAYSGHAIAAPAIVTKTISPAVSSVSSYSTHTAHGGPITTYAAGPIVAKSYAAPALAYSAAPVATYAAAPVITKTITPAVSSISSYSTQTAHGGAYAAPIVAKSYAAPALAYSAGPVATYAAAPVATYAAAPVATYAAAPVVTKTITPAVSSVSSYSTHTAHGGAYAAPIVAKSYAAPALAYSAAATYGAAPFATYAAAPVATYAAAPVVTKTITPAVSSVSSYSTHTAHGGAYGAPLIAKSYAAPAVATYSAPLIAKSYGAYSAYAAGAPILKSAVTYSAAPAVGHFAYSGHGANSGW